MEQQKPLILGITGAIGCGKTAVGDILLRLGALERIDADRVVHQLMTPGTEVTARIAAEFGPDVLDESGAVHRGRLAELVFASSKRREELEAIVHPAVRTDIRRRLAWMSGRQGVVVVDAVRLLQSDLLPEMDAVWVVQCAPEVQWSRLTQNRSMAPQAAKARLRAQPAFEHPAVAAVIENSGSRGDLEQQVRFLWQALSSERTGSND